MRWVIRVLLFLVVLVLLGWAVAWRPLPGDPQIRRLRERFAVFAPTLVLVEGRLGWWIGGNESLISRFGESGAAAALAADAGSPSASTPSAIIIWSPPSPTPSGAASACWRSAARAT